MTTTPKPLSADELAGYLFDYNKGEVDLTSVWHARLLATITQAHADLAREKARGDEAELTFLKHTAHVKLWTEQLAPYLGLDDDSATIKPIDIIEAAEKCRQFADDQSTTISALRSQLAEAIKAQRTRGTREVCFRCGTIVHDGAPLDGCKGPALDCPIKAARTQEGI